MKNADLNTILRRLVEIQTCLWVLVVVGIVAHGYLGKTWSEVQVFRADDGWCEPGVHGLGVHCFGDFGLPYSGGTSNTVYTEGNPAATYSPLASLLFMALRLLSYDQALIFYLLILAASALLPFVWKSRTRPLGFRLQVATLFGVISTGSIAAFDRGNHVLLLVPLIYGYILAIEKSNWVLAVLFLVGIALLKFWGVIFVVALIAKRKLKFAAVALAIIPVLTLVLLFPFGRSISDSAAAMYKAVVDRDYGNIVSRYAFSIQGLIRRSVCYIQSDTLCNPVDHANDWEASVVLSISVLVVLLLMVYFVMQASSDAPHVWILLLVATGFLGVPEAPVYQLALVSSGIAAILALGNYRIGREWRWSTLTLMAAVVVSSTPVTLYSNQASRFSASVDEGPAIFRSDQWLIPLCWIVAFSVTIIEAARTRQTNLQSRKSVWAFQE